MNKALVRPNLDYCDVIYHIPSKQDQLGGILNSLMVTAEKVQLLKGMKGDSESHLVIVGMFFTRVTCY